MAITVDNLEIEISASAQSAVTRIRELISALEDLHTVTNKKFGNISSKIDQVAKSERPKKQKQTASDSVKYAKDEINANEELAGEINKAAVAAQKATDASKDYYAEIKKIINGTSREALNLRLLSAQIKAVTSNLNKMYQEGKGEEPAAQKALLNLYDLTEKYNRLSDEFSRTHALVLYSDVQGTDGIKNSGEALENLQNNVKSASRAGTVFKQALESGILEPVKKANSAVAKFGSQVGGFLAKQLRNAASGAAKLSLSIAERPFIRLGNAVINASKSFRVLIDAIGRIAFYRTIRRAIQMITGSLQEGIQNLYQYSKIVNTQFHQSMDRLATDALYVKNSFASIAGPLIDAVAPAIDVIADKLANAMSIAAEFVAGVTGQAEYSRAVKQSTEYAEAVEGIGEAAKNAKKYLLGIDELTIFDPGTEKDIPDYSSMFEQVPVSTNMLDAIDRIKESIDGIPQVVHTAWEMTGLDMVDAWKTALKSVLDLVTDIKLTSKQVFTDGFGLDLLNSVFNMLGSIANIITVIMDAFRVAWDDDGRGYEYIASIYTMFTDINNLLIGIAATFSAAWNNGVGVEIAKDLLDIFTGLHETVGNLAESIRRAWEDTGLGESVWGHVLDIVHDVLDSINTMVQVTAEWAAGLDFEPLFSAFDKALEGLEPLVKLIADEFAWAWQNVLLPFGSWTIQEALPAVIETLSAAFDLLTVALETLKPFAEYLWDEFLKPLAEWSGEAFISAMNEITDLFRDFADLINGKISLGEFIGNLSAVQTIIISIVSVVGTLEALLAASSIWKLASGGVLGKLVEVFAYVSGGAGTLHEAMMLVFGPGSIIAGIAGLVGGAVLALTNFFSMLENGFSGVHEVLMLIGIAIAAVSAIILGVPFIVAAVVAGVVAAVATLAVVIKEHWDAIVDFFANLPEKIGYALGFIVGKLSNFVVEFVKNLGDLIPHIVNIVHDISKLVVDFVVEFPKKFKELYDKMREIGREIIVGIWHGITEKLTDFWNNVTGFISGFIDGFKDALGIHSPSTVFADIGKNLIAGLFNGISDTWHSITDFFGDALENLKTGFSNTWENIKSGASEKWDGIKSTLSGAWENIKSSAKEKFEDITGAVSQSWSNTATESASNVKSLKTDTERELNALKMSTKSISREIDTETVNSWKDMKNGTAGATAELNAQISKTFNSIKTTISNIWAGIKNSTQTTLSSISGIVGSMTNTISGAVSGIKSKLSDIVSSASNSANSVNTKMGQIMTDIADSTEKASRNLSNIQVKQYASGGTVPSGQMFIARERGPELVGAIGNQTGVANNEQIVRGIASGVSEANEEVITALYAAAMQIVSAVRENGGSAPDWNTTATNVTRVQNRYARMSGKAVTYN